MARSIVPWAAVAQVSPACPGLTMQGQPSQPKLLLDSSVTQCGVQPFLSSWGKNKHKSPLKVSDKFESRRIYKDISKQMQKLDLDLKEKFNALEISRYHYVL